MLNSLEDFLMPEEMQSLRDNQLRMYLTFSKGILWCPNKSCGYAGYVSKSSQQDFFCEKCQECWIQEDPSNNLAAIRSLMEEGLNIGWKALFCKTCPGCEVFIEKNQGCRHIDCIMCGTDFCWYCKQSYKTHKQNQCSNKHAELIYHSAIAIAALIVFIKASLLFDPVYSFAYYCLGVPLWCFYILIFKIFFGVIVTGLVQMFLSALYFTFSFKMANLLLLPFQFFLHLLQSYWVAFMIPSLAILCFSLVLAIKTALLTPNLN
jgi:hypothetical protein